MPLVAAFSCVFCRLWLASVIGSMWSVDDEAVSQVVSAFYDEMFDGSGRLDCTPAAVALQKAVTSLSAPFQPHSPCCLYYYCRDCVFALEV